MLKGRPNSPQHVFTRIDEIERRENEPEGQRDSQSERDTHDEPVVLMRLDSRSANGDDSDGPQEPERINRNREVLLTHQPDETHQHERQYEQPDGHAEVPFRPRLLRPGRRGLVRSDGMYPTLR